MENTTAAVFTPPSAISPAPESPAARAAALRAYKQRLVERIPATVSDDYRKMLVDTIEAQVDMPSLDCGLRWAVEAAYHNGIEPPSHEVVALCLCFGSGALEGDVLRVQRSFYARQPRLAHHIRDWSLRGLVDKHSAKVCAGDIDDPPTTAAARRKKRPASAVGDLSPPPTACRPEPPVDPFTVYHESDDTPRLNSLVKSHHAEPKKSATPEDPAVPQAILDRLPPSFMDPRVGGFAQLKQLRSPGTDTIRDTVPPSGRTGGPATFVSLFSDPRSTAGPVPVGLGSLLFGGDPATRDTKEAAAAAAIAAATATASPNASDTPGTAAENPWAVADAAAETRLASLAAQIAGHRRRARDKLQHAATLRGEHARAAERQPLEVGALPADIVTRVNEDHGLASRCLRHQEEAVAAVAEADRLEGERAEEVFRRIERRLDRIHAVVVGTADALGTERAACASFTAQQVDRATALKARRERRAGSQG
ncbi:uncharacterized protein LY79DRAFT_694028 [Colletotrichum navitas]|uniref:Uncharacterized protein n=1 Tax=Colletotrichum navitas TaxID=681940 RepID=A0AAD8V279_9PEZI|nr:uncharacterized protein LY79DRAFT_694028 [Colletotrichum navitas]KAK1579473.1 hypothetical protein LY79DRAFT_694028 [Colletotrichum navitas]